MIHELKVKLKQHTPLIHFQHDQEGATLRASEVKPKLDKYILSVLGNGNYQDGINQAKNRGWLIGTEGHPALNYKMKIKADRQTSEYLLGSLDIKPNELSKLRNNNIEAIGNTAFFAQEKQNRQICDSSSPSGKWARIEKKGILENGDVTISIISTIIVSDSPLQYVADNIQDFFASTNFGTRQSKGFGCFWVTSVILDRTVIPIKDREKMLRNQFAFVYKKQLKKAGVSQILSTINDDYKLLKSGRRVPYAKSKLLLYTESKNPKIGWDKKYVKVNSDNFANEQNEPYVLLNEHPQNKYSDKVSYKYFRAVLGVAEQYEFLLKNPPEGKKRNRMIVKIKSETIQRFQSPLLFKVSDSTIYLVGNELPSEILAKPFDYYVTIQGDEAYQNERLDLSGEHLYTPSSFSLRDFIDFAMRDNTNDARLEYTNIKKTLDL